jgi:serine phosphatase RsbU (regulator of sigma subunit)
MDVYIQIFLSTLALAFGILHFIIYLYSDRQKANLYFALFLIFYALNTFFDYQSSITSSTSIEYTYLRIHRGLFPFTPIFALLFVYSLFKIKFPKQFWFISIALLIFTIPAIIKPVEYFNYVQILLIAVLIESIRVYINIIRAKVEGAIIVSFAFSMLMIFSIYDLLLDFNLLDPIYNIRNGNPFGFLILLFLMSVYLARNFARANKEILTKEREAQKMELSQKLLEVEDKRKSKELNDARELQLSLLPHCANNIGNLEICFDMRTASEVGGDYYDYELSEDGELSIVIGDATDHGMKAGMMVSIVKSLFLARDKNTEIKEFFNNCSKTIKQMKLKNLFMALMVIKIRGENLISSSAGIPPFLVYRKKTKLVEEFKTKGMPLGAVDNFPYQTIEAKLEIGDTVLLMTDGLIELFNGEKVQFGEDRIKEIFKMNALLPVTEIIAKLFSAGEEWVGNNNQNDDITLVAFRLNK